MGMVIISKKRKKEVLKMAWGDGTGPNGLGPMTGRGAGYCAGFNVPGYANPGVGAGRGGFEAEAVVSAAAEAEGALAREEALPGALTLITHRLLIRRFLTLRRWRRHRKRNC